MTHLAVALANYTTSGLGEKTACVEIGGHGQLSQWKKAEKDGYFTDQGVFYYPDYSKERIPVLLNMDYERIILDFGDAYLSCREEIMRCDRKIFLLNLNPWQTFAARYLLRMVQTELWGNMQPVYGAVNASHKVKKAVEKEFQIKVEEIPIVQDACCIQGKYFSVFHLLLGNTAVTRKKKLRIPNRRKI
ncbi:MAG: hypothetical protein J6A75_05640 [Lachnospiraceae bacterium]|nr:hypothetical protein [Lachnospiraceae bacterium]